MSRWISRDEEAIRGIAWRVRDRLGYCDAECVTHAEELRNALLASGWYAVRVFGYFLLDGIWIGEPSKEQLAWIAEGGHGKPPSPLPVEWAKDTGPEGADMDYDHPHNWVIVGDYVVDTGAEQFNPLIRLQREKSPPIYVAHRSRAHRYVVEEIVPRY